MTIKAEKKDDYGCVLTFKSTSSTWEYNGGGWFNVGFYSMALTNWPDVDDYGLQCTVQVSKDSNDGIKSVTCDSMVLVSPIEGLPDSKWGEFKTDIKTWGTNQGGWEFEVEFDSEHLDIATMPVVNPGDTIFVFYETETSEDWHYY